MGLIRMRFLSWVAAAAAAGSRLEHSLQPVGTISFDATPASLPLDTLAQTELMQPVEIGATTVPVASVSGFQVGGAVRLHAGGANQEDHRIRAISHTSLWLAGSGLEGTWEGL